MRRLGKFEWKIISALWVTAAAPLLFTYFMVDRLVEESMAVGLNEQVLDGLRSGVDLYKEVIESRLRIARMQGEHLADSQRFRRALAADDEDELNAALENMVHATSWISRARLLAGGRERLAVTSPLQFADAEWKSKTETWPLDEGRVLELTYVISRQFLAASNELRELVVTMEALAENFQPWKMGYYRLFLFIYFFILVAAVILGVLLARSVTKRIAALVRATEQASRGDLTARVPVASRDEIGALAQSFNQMLDDIQRGRDRIVYLEKVSSWQEIARRMAHEIKNPLTPIQLAVQELHRSYRGGDERFRGKLDESLEIVEEEVGTLRRMVQTFSEFARMPTVALEPAELNEFAADYLKLHPQYAERVELHTLDEPVSVELDRGLMGRVLSNLIDNGLEAGPSGAGVTLRVGRNQRQGLLLVEDRGGGLTPEVRRQLFQPYFTTKEHGTGLGLAIVKKIVLQHGGEIAVAETEAGTVFSVALRIVDPATAGV